MSNPYPVSGTVYDVNGTTAKASVVLTAKNITTGEWIKESRRATSSATGEYILDLADFPSGYTNGDVVQVIACDTTGYKTLDVQHTIDTVTGILEKDIILHNGEIFMDTIRVSSLIVTNSTGGGLKVDFYDRKNNFKRVSVECPAGDTKVVYFGKIGLRFDGGICRIFEAETAGSLEVTTVLDNITGD